MKIGYSCWGIGVLSVLALQAGAAVVGRVTTVTAGEVECVCEQAGGWSFDLETDGGSGPEVVTLKMHAPAEAVPPEVTVRFEVQGTGAQHVWTSYWMNDAYHLWADEWKDKKYSSQLAFGTPIAVAFDGDEHALVGTACSEVFDKVEYSLRIKENTCVLKGEYRFFTEAANAMRDYRVKIFIDNRSRFWADAVTDASAWICRENGFVAAAVPDAARDPLYSTWYAYWQDVHAEPLEREAKLAADLGMKTMILDDGWQKIESASFYSATGDWMPVASRFPDMRAHVAKVQSAGLKYMLWLSVPYVGDESRAWSRFEKKMLYVHGSTSPGRIGVLDPRFPDVREYLISTYERVVGEWGFDGVKLDFIDSFKLNGDDPAVMDGYAGRDFRSVPAAVDRLMTDILLRLRKLKPDVLVEFRQSYMGPAILKYGNMIRAADCPADPWSNRKRICDLRLTSGKTAVHSDMIVWNRNETPEGAALPILNALFSTIQYSMILAEAPESHREVIRHWLAFSQRHRKALLQGSFRPRHPEANYPVIEASDEREHVAVVYNSSAFAELPAGKEVFVINATRSPRLAVDSPCAGEAQAFDTFGASVGRRFLSKGLNRIAVPPCGYLRLNSSCADDAGRRHFRNRREGS